MRLLTLAAVVAAALVVVAAAAAHVTVRPNQVPADADLTLFVNVPNESEDADTTQVDLQLPSGFIEASTAPVPGWTARVTTAKLAQPVTLDGEEHDTEVREIVWSGGKIAPGEFMQFPISVAVPDEAGTTLTFKAIQTYSDGKVVRWIGDAGSDEPAPQVAVVAADAPVADVPAGAEAAQPSGGGSSDTRTNVALGLAIAGLAVGVAALVLVLARRRPRA